MRIQRDLKTYSKYALCRSERKLVLQIVKYNCTPETSKINHIIISRLYKRLSDLKNEKVKAILTDWYNKYYDMKETYRYEIMLIRK